MEKKYYDPSKYQHRVVCVFTKKEGELLNIVLDNYRCKNASQLIKLILNGTHILISKEELEMLYASKKKNSATYIEDTARKKRITSILKEYNYASLEDLKADLEKLNQKNEEDN